MKIKEIRAVEIELNPKPMTTPRTPSRAGTFPMNRPSPVMPQPTEEENMSPVRDGTDLHAL